MKRANPQRHFAGIPEPGRATRNKLHKLEDSVMIPLCAVLCGFEDGVSEALHSLAGTPGGAGRQEPAGSASPCEGVAPFTGWSVQSVEKDHGRIGRRRVVVSNDLDWLADRKR